jgi:hypothetical protein
MRRGGILLSGFVVAMAVMAQPALATFHLNMVNEVMLGSASGDAGVQFVEFLDHGGSEEVFPPVFAPFRLAVYDGAGNKLGEQMLDPAGLRTAAAADKEYLVSTAAADSALGVTGNERLTVSLPQGSGQACFEANPSPPAFSCLTWGTISKPVQTNSMGTGSVHGPTPPNGQSDQRLVNNSVVAAAPTPKARNAAGSGGGGGTKPPFAGVHVGTGRASVDRRGRAHVALKCPAGSGGCSGRLTLKARSGGAGFGSAAFSIKAGRTKTLAVPLTAVAMHRLARKHSLKARATARAHDAAGHKKTSSAAIVLR